MSNKLEHAIVKILSENGRVVGAGFAIDTHYIVTCAHVVMSALSLVDSQHVPESSILLNYPFLKHNEAFTAKVVKWLPKSADDTGDVAILHVEAAPDEVQPVQLISVDDHKGHSFSAFGFPDHFPGGRWVEGKLQRKLTNGRLQVIGVSELGFFIEPGFSGGLVWNEDLHCVAGMAVTADTPKEGRTAAIIPVNLLIEAFSSIPTYMQAEMEIFLSYSSQDTEMAVRLETMLKQDGFKVWRDRNHLRSGAQFTLQLENAIRRSDAVVLLVSRSAKKSTWVANETLFAMDLGKGVFPVVVEPNETLPIYVYSKQYVDVCLDWDVGYGRLVSDLRDYSSSTSTHHAAQEDVSSSKLTTNAHILGDPFIVGAVVPDTRFIGRKAEIHSIVQRLSKETMESVSIVANRRMGKTSLLNYLCKRSDTIFPPTHEWVLVYMSMMDKRLHSPKGIMRAIRRSLEKSSAYNLWDSSEDGDIDTFMDVLEEFATEPSRRLVFCFDEFESVMAYLELDDFIESLRYAGERSWIGIVTSTTRTLIDLTQNNRLTSPFYNIFQTEYLSLMPKDEWTVIVKDGFQQVGVSVNSDQLKQIEIMAGGHPYLTQLAGSLLLSSVRERWTDTRLQSEYERDAQMIFSSIWQSLSAQDIDAVKSLLSRNSASIPAKILDEFRDRGVINDEGVLFCRPFEKFARFSFHSDS